MSNDNSPLQFAPKSTVPIIGQPCTVHSWFPTTVVICGCEAKQPVVVVGLNAISTCPSCGRGFRLHGVRQDIRTGKPPHFDIDVVVMSPASPAGEPEKPA